MKRGSLCSIAFSLAVAAAQNPNHVPIYSVTVTERTTQAVNYQYRSGPTQIDFRGTVLLPSAKGDAWVESQRGRTEITATFRNLTAPTQYGREYLTYTLWAVTPEGSSHNLGEIVPDGGDKAKIHVTTDLQAFGLIVTAEPYSTARHPSDVVVMENQVRPDTIGTIKPIEAKYELMPRGQYTYQVPEKLGRGVSEMPKVSMNEYEALLEIYEAQNAIGIARAAGADQFAANTLQRADTLLAHAQQMQATRQDSKAVVQNAREASQTAEDARMITERRRQDEKVASAERQVMEAQQLAAAAQQAQQQAQIDTQRALADAQAARAQAEAERAARQQAEANTVQAQQQVRQSEASRMTASALASPPPPPPGQPVAGQDPARTDLRMRLFEQLNGILPTRDTPRGVVVTVPDSAFNGLALRDDVSSQLSRVAAVVGPYAALKMDVEGFSDTAANEGSAWNRADAVNRCLLREGMPANRLTARGLGDSRPLGPNTTPTGRMENRRVEIVISGDAIGTMPFWDKTYSVVPSRR